MAHKGPHEASASERKGHFEKHRSAAFERQSEYKMMKDGGMNREPRREPIEKPFKHGAAETIKKGGERDYGHPIGRRDSKIGSPEKSKPGDAMPRTIHVRKHTRKAAEKRASR